MKTNSKKNPITSLALRLVLFVATICCGLSLLTSTAGAATVAGWDFTGANTAVTSLAATAGSSSYNANLDSANTLTMASGMVAVSAGNSFRSTSFGNNTANNITTANTTKYYQVTLSAATGFTLSLSSIDAFHNGTAGFSTGAGVATQWSYSTDGSAFTLIGSSFAKTGNGADPQVDLTGITALQAVPASTTVTLRYYCAGQSTTGSWGFTSTASGAVALNIQGTVDSAGGAPSAPSATAATSVTDTSFSANWGTPSGSPTSYRVDVATDTAFTSFVSGWNDNNVGLVNTASVTSLSPNTTYYYRVRAVNGSGTSGNSSTITVTTATTPSAPTATAATSVASASFSANWGTPAGVPTSYRLDVATDTDFTSFVSGYSDLNVGNVNTYSVTGLTPSTAYHYRVRAVNAYGTSGNSGTIDVTTTAAVVPKILVTLPGEAGPNAGGATAQSAGTAFTITLTTTTDGSTVDTAYTGNHAISLSGFAGISNAAPTVNFSSGVGTVSIAVSNVTSAAITATDGTIAGTASSSLTVNLGAINHYVVTATTPQSQGVGFTVTVTAKDHGGNTVTTDSSTSVTMSSSGATTFGANPVTLASGTFNVTATDNTAETMTITATDGTPKTGTSSSIVVNAATTYTWAGDAGGSNDWALAASWSPARTTPAINDILVFNGGAYYTATNIPSQTIAKLQVSSSTTANLQSATGQSKLTIGSTAASDALTVSANSALKITWSDVSTNLQLFVAAGALGSIDGTVTLTTNDAPAATANFYSIQATNVSAITFNSGSVLNQNSAGSFAGGSGLNGKVVFAAGSIFSQTAGSNPFGASQPNSITAWQPSSLFQYKVVGGTPAFSGRTYSDLEYNVAGGNASGSGSAALSISNIIGTAGALNFGVTATPGHSLKGNVTVASGATINFNPASAGTININGNSVQHFSGSGTINLGASVTLAVVNASTLSIDTAVTGSGAITVANGGKLKGTGSTGAAVTANGAVAPGSSVGNLSVGSLTMAPGGSEEVELGAVSGTAGTDWDVITVGSGTGATTVSATTGSKFTVKVIGNPTGWDNNGQYDWLIVSSASPSGFSASKFTIDTSGLTGAAAGFTHTWGLAADASGIHLTYGCQQPTATLGANPAVCQGTTSANLSYSNPQNSPDYYSINYGAAAEAQGFVDVPMTALGASPFVLAVPAGAAAGTYSATLILSNSAATCEGSSSFSVTVNTFSVSGTAYLETVGNPGATTAFGDIVWDNSDPITYSSVTNPPDGRITTASSGYTGASGLGNLFYAATVGTRNFEVTGINTVGRHNPTLSFGLKSEAAGGAADPFTVEYSTNGVDYVSVTNISESTSNWSLRTPDTILPEVSSLTLRFGKTNDSSWRLDDIKVASADLSAAVIYGAEGVAYGETTTLSAPAGAVSYLWSDGSTGTSITTNAGTYTLTMVDSHGCSSLASHTITNMCPTITVNDTLPDGNQFAPYTNSISASGSSATPYTYTVTAGSPPAGLSLTTAGSLEGTPTSMGAGSPFTVTATDTNGCQGSVAVTVDMGCPVITLSNVTNAYKLVKYLCPVTASPAGTYVFTNVSGALPPGLTLTNSTGKIGGKASVYGLYTFTLMASNTATGCTGTRTYSVYVNKTGAADTKQPVVTIKLPTPNAVVTNAVPVIVSGKVSDDVLVTNVEYNLDSTGWAVATAQSATNFSVSIGTLAPGLHTVQVRATDLSGNVDTLVNIKSVTFHYGTHSFVNQGGIYFGLFSESAGVATNSAGFAKIVVTAKEGKQPTFSATVWVDGKKHLKAGKFEMNGIGTFNTPIDRTVIAAGPLTASLTLPLVDGATTLGGSILNQTTVQPGEPLWTADVTANLCLTNAGTVKVPIAGSTNWDGTYTVVVPSFGPEIGDGYSPLIITNGIVKLAAGKLADNQAFTLVTAPNLDAAGNWPVFVQSDKIAGRGQSILYGWISVPSFSGSLNWIKGANQLTYPAGFNTNVTVEASTYGGDPGTTLVLPLNNVSPTKAVGNVDLNNGGLTTNIVNSITLTNKGTANKFIDNLYTKLNHYYTLTLTLTPKTGALGGTFNNVGNGASITAGKITGIVMTNQYVGRGFFIATKPAAGTSSGTFLLTP